MNYTEDVTRTKFAINRKSNCFGNLKSPTADHEENLIEIVLALSNNNLAHYNLFKHSVDVDRMEVFCITQKLDFFRKNKKKNIYFGKVKKPRNEHVLA